MGGEGGQTGAFGPISPKAFLNQRPMILMRVRFTRWRLLHSWSAFGIGLPTNGGTPMVSRMRV
jgi:hypothetical protein